MKIVIVTISTILSMYSCQNYTNEQNTILNKSTSNLLQISKNNVITNDNNKQTLTNYTYSDAEKEIIAKNYVDVTTYNQTLKIALAYSTTNNFLNADVYGDINKCFLIDKVAKQISNAQNQLIKDNPNCSYVLYDCLRPYSVQKIMWKYAKKTNKTEYVANPEKGGRSFHNLGVSIDVGLICDNKVIDMGSTFDDFSDRSKPSLENKFLQTNKLTKEHINNRELLRKYLLKNNFNGISSEWWHFDGINRKDASKYKVYGK